ncbi:MAG: PIG-L family deacetylase [Chloroflexota bacterium]
MSHHLSLLACFAHPDDEGLVTGAFARYRQEGARIALICATRGEVGEIAPGVNATRETLGAVREHELRTAMSHADVEEIYFLDYRDSGMDGTDENQHPDNFHNAPLDEVTGKVVRIIRETKPQVMVTFDPGGGYGHPDHIKIHHAAMAAFNQAGDPTCFVEQLTNGLQPHTPLKLYWNAFSREFFIEMARFFKEQGIDTAQFGAFDPTKRGTPTAEITTKLDVSAYRDLKTRAWTSHASQQNPNSIFAKAPPELWEKFRATENFVLAASRLPKPNGIEDDLFAGVR